MSEEQRAKREAEVLRGNERLATSASTRNPLIRLFTDRRFATRVVRYLLGRPVPLETEDRRVLEQVIFPYYSSLPGIRRVLFVGCRWYTKHYEKSYFSDKDFWTIDPDAGSGKSAGRQHVIAGLERLDEFFPEERFDLIICNGVYGFGLDGREQCERAFDLCYSRLVRGGHFVFGWTDVPARTPVPLDEIESLKRFQKYTFPQFGSWRYVTDTPYRHTYDFYCK